jgi:hypothetical protein
MGRPLTMMAAGELILGMSEPSPEFYFDLVAPTLNAADLVVAHLESTHIKSPAWAGGMSPRPVDWMRGIPYAGIDAVTMGYGATGIKDATDWLKEHNVAYCGSGKNITEAKKPLIMERDGVRFGFLFYQCVHENAANTFKPGCAYVDIITQYGGERAKFPGDPPEIFTFAERWSLQAMKEDIKALRSRCDILSVALHMGGAITEVVLQDYEFDLSYAAIDAGADIILGNHTHVLRGIEYYNGKPIIHCLGNLVAVFPWETHQMFREPEPASTLTKSKWRYKYGHSRQWIDPEYPCYAFPAWARKGMIVKTVIENKKIARLSFLPLMMNKQGQPEILKHDSRGQEVFDYMRRVSSEEGLETRYEWQGDEVVVHE